MQNTPGRRLSKTLFILKQSKNGDQNSIEMVFSIAICHTSGDKWQSKTVSNYFYLRSSTILVFLIAAYPVCDYAACNPGQQCL